MLIIRNEIPSNPNEGWHLTCFCHGIMKPYSISVPMEEGAEFRGQEEKYLQYHCGFCGFASPQIVCRCVDEADKNHLDCRNYAKQSAKRILWKIAHLEKVQKSIRTFLRVAGFQDLPKRPNHYQKSYNE